MWPTADGGHSWMRTGMPFVRPFCGVEVAECENLRDKHVDLRATSVRK